MAEHASPRVNAVHFPNFVGRTARLTGKVIRVNGDVAMIESPDGKEVEVRLINGVSLTSTFVEVIGTVIDATKIKMMAVIPLHDNTNLKVAAHTAEMWHDPRFASGV
ncbi:replication factor A protein 3 [Amylocystis lapponica]|nr:replication factor A protein 3 [Amylocystis lapponica]